MTKHQRSSLRVFCVFALLVLLLSPHCGVAQTNLATIRGQVADQQGATVPEAVVTARETRTNLTRSSTTQQDGQYLLSNLPAGQ